jgi:hypothetical protein
MNVTNFVLSRMAAFVLLIPPVFLVKLLLRIALYNHTVSHRACLIALFITCCLTLAQTEPKQGRENIIKIISFIFLFIYFHPYCCIGKRELVQLCICENWLLCAVLNIELLEPAIMTDAHSFITPHLMNTCCCLLEITITNSTFSQHKIVQKPTLLFVHISSRMMGLLGWNM